MLRFSSTGRPLPVPTPFMRGWFDALETGRLLLQHCPRSGPFFYPRLRCPCCLRDDWSWRDAAGTGSVHTFAIQNEGSIPGAAAASVKILALVELIEGPRVAAEIQRCAPELIYVGMPVQATFLRIESTTLLAFRPS